VQKVKETPVETLKRSNSGFLYANQVKSCPTVLRCFQPTLAVSRWPGFGSRRSRLCDVVLCWFPRLRLNMTSGPDTIRLHSTPDSQSLSGCRGMTSKLCYFMIWELDTDICWFLTFVQGRDDKIPRKYNSWTELYRQNFYSFTRMTAWAVETWLQKCRVSNMKILVINYLMIRKSGLSRL
jgi:hypothetical protein